MTEKTPGGVLPYVYFLGIEEASLGALDEVIENFGPVEFDDTHSELDSAISSLPEEETEHSGFICSRCCEIVDKVNDDCEGSYASTKTITTRETASKGLVGGIKLKGTQFICLHFRYVEINYLCVLMFIIACLNINV